MGFLKNLGVGLLAKSAFLTSALVTYSYHDEVQKIDYNLFDKKQKIAETYYPNPAVLRVGWASNDDGFIHTYLQNSESGLKLPLHADLLPDNTYLLNHLEDRLDTASNPKQVTKQLFSLYLKASRSSGYSPHDSLQSDKLSSLKKDVDSLHSLFNQYIDMGANQ